LVIRTEGASCRLGAWKEKRRKGSSLSENQGEYPNSLRNGEKGRKRLAVIEEEDVGKSGHRRPRGKREGTATISCDAKRGGNDFL